MQDAFYAGRVVDAWQLHEDLGLPIGSSTPLHTRFGHSEAVYFPLERVDRSDQRVLPERQGSLPPQGELVAGGTHGRQHPFVSHCLLYGLRQGPRAARENSSDIDLNRFGGLDRLWIVAVHGAELQILFGENRLEVFDDLIGLGLKGVLNLDLKDHMTAAFQVQTEADVSRPVRH